MRGESKLEPYPGSLNPLSPNSDQHQISLIVYSTPEDTGIKDKVNSLNILITSPPYFYKKSIGTR